MNISVLGIGYVGLVTATCLAEIGNDVVCFDVDREKIDLLGAGGTPIHERDLPELIARNVAFARLRFTSDVAEAVHHGDVIFIATGTPAGEDGSADLQYVLAAAQSIGANMLGDKVVVQKSTVPVGTAARVREAIEEALRTRRDAGDGAIARLSATPIALVSNPEFLKEGAAVDDFMRPDRIVIGTEPGPAGERARALMGQLYAPFNRQRDRILHMDIGSAEFTKYAANAMLATRISFMNELANLADELGVDIEQVRKGIGADPRIGYGFLYAGVGYGGSCFPKDVQALVHTAAGHGKRLKILEAVRSVNEAQKHVLVDKVVGRFGADLRGRTFALWGLAFKPNTDDMREAPSRVMVKALLERGAEVIAYDPVAMAEAKRILPEDLGANVEAARRLRYADSPMQAVQSADALIVMTEWKAFKSPNFAALKSALRQPVIFDGRNLYDPAIRTQGFEYFAIGR
ncbi:MAG: UDP-glucose/GDP-mannose dehydrogenase family protein [Pseudomonadota bacterium]|nr:UDP-glucose/GDP-mannose dehydrogenase family protein [Pseudomonadota bacterium]